MKSRILVWLILAWTASTGRGREEVPAWPVLEDVPAGEVEALPGTGLLTAEGDLANALMDGVQRFVAGEIARSGERREAKWEGLVMEPAAARARLGEVIGLPKGIVEGEAAKFTYVSEDPGDLRLATGPGFDVYEVRWPVFRDVTGEGVLLLPKGGTAKADVVLVPDADGEPEWLVESLMEGEGNLALARRLAEKGCRVLVPSLIGRSESLQRLSWREYVNRPAFELGHHIVGYEVAKVMAGVSALQGSGECGLAGYGEGGLIALYAAALDERVRAVVVSGYFGPREGMWDEPAYRNFHGLLEEFGDAEVAALMGARTLIIEAAPGPDILVASPGYDEQGKPVGKDYTKGKPGQLSGPKTEVARKEHDRLKRLLETTGAGGVVGAFYEADRFGTDEAVSAFLGAIGIEVLPLDEPANGDGSVHWLRALADVEARQARQRDEIVAHNEWLLGESSQVRAEFMKGLRTDSMEAFKDSVEGYRQIFREEVIGHFDRELVSPNARSRSYQKGAGVHSYEVVMDVFPDVVAYGILTVPDDLPLDGSEVRPCVVCQHGLEGRPQQTIGEEKYSAYKAFATRLAQRGFVTFAPQNLYRGNDRFRLLQFKLNSLGKTLFSIMVPQHEQMVGWLGALPFVDAERIGFYGLSYGGKSAMRIPPLVEGYALSICSGDFNEWIWKNCSTNSEYSYVDKREYEIFEWNLGMTFNYAEMAALIAPRPFMVERGHFDGVAPDEMVAYEFAKVRRLYDLLGIGERAEIEWFMGPHTINGVGTFLFLDRWMKEGGKN